MKEKLKLDLQLFGEGGAAGDGGEGAGNAGNVSNSGLSGDINSDLAKYFGISTPHAPEAETQDENNGEKNGVSAEDNADTEENNASAAVEQPQDPIDEDAEWERRIAKGGKDHDRFAKKTQAIINERFKGMKDLEAKVAGYGKLVSPLLDKYGLAEDASLEELENAIKNDNANFSRQAMREGVSTEAYRDGFYTKLEERAQAQAQAEADARAQADADAAEHERRTQATVDRWQKESDELKKSFPQFDLEAELTENPAFYDALVKGLPVAQAYYGANFDKLSSGIAAAAAQDATVKAAQTIAQHRSRPGDGGINSGTGIKTGSIDVNKLTSKDILKIIDNVSKGAKYSF